MSKPWQTRFGRNRWHLSVRATIKMLFWAPSSLAERIGMPLLAIVVGVFGAAFTTTFWAIEFTCKVVAGLCGFLQEEKK